MICQAIISRGQKFFSGESWTAKENRRSHLLGEPERFDIERVEAQIYFIDCARRDHEDIRKFRIAADVNFDSSAR
jgi:hypothetical protein